MGGGEGISISVARDFDWVSACGKRPCGDRHEDDCHDDDVSRPRRTPRRREEAECADNGNEDCDGGEEEEDQANDAIATNIDGVYATAQLSAGDVALFESELPDCALPRSSEPNCSVVYDFQGGDEAALVALKDIAVGECFTVAPSSDEEDLGDEEDEEEEFFCFG